jgi:non-ribosomal peptide synthase protein (TIGR01720 family)
VEQTLADIWDRCLGFEGVGIHDNFFELGGDSVISIMIISQAYQADLRFSLKQMFEHQTIAELATVVDRSQKIAAEQGLVTGPLPLTPIQHWFFEQNLPDPHHFNLPLLLETRRALDPALLERALQQLAVNHDALRLRYVQEDSGWQQANADVGGVVGVRRLDLSRMPEAEQKVALEAAATELQASLDLSEGPLLRAALFDFGAQKPSRLLVVIHHLAVDVVSWRILLGDLQTAYQQLSRGESVQLAPKTTSFKRWSEQLREYARSEALEGELDYWLSPSWTRISSLPVNYPEGANTVVSARTVSVSLSAAETVALLQEVPKAYNTQTDDVLLTALGQTLSRWTGRQSHLVAIEGNGRDLVLEGVDLSRTVGWFTTICPVLLDSGDSSSSGDALRSIKEQLRRRPNQGFGYGLLRYLKGDAAIAERLRALPQPEVSFVYLGQLDQELSASSPFKLVLEASGPARSPRGSRSHLLEIVALVAEGCLRVDWSYSEQVHRRVAIEGLAQSFLEALRSLIVHCQSPEAGGFTPSDFPDIDLSQQELDELLRKIS